MGPDAYGSYMAAGSYAYTGTLGAALSTSFRCKACVFSGASYAAYTGFFAVEIFTLGAVEQK